MTDSVTLLSTSDIARVKAQVAELFPRVPTYKDSSGREYILLEPKPIKDRT